MSALNLKSVHQVDVETFNSTSPMSSSWWCQRKSQEEHQGQRGLLSADQERLHKMSRQSMKYLLNVWAKVAVRPTDGTLLASHELLAWLKIITPSFFTESSSVSFFFFLLDLTTCSLSLYWSRLKKKKFDWWKAYELLSLLHFSQEELNSAWQLCFTACVDAIAARCPCSYDNLCCCHY